MEDRIQPVADAVLGRSDDTRRWAISDRSGAPRFPGLTRPEARVALSELPAESWHGHLVAVALPVLLTDGAGPHLLDAEGNLVLALAEHPRLPACKLALGPRGGKEQAGLVVPAASDAVWRWMAHAVFDPAHRVSALDGLGRIERREEIDRWLRDATGWG